MPFPSKINKLWKWNATALKNKDVSLKQCRRPMQTVGKSLDSELVMRAQLSVSFVGVKILIYLFLTGWEETGDILKDRVYYSSKFVWEVTSVSFFFVFVVIEWVLKWIWTKQNHAECPYSTHYSFDGRRLYARSCRRIFLPRTNCTVM